MAAHDLCTGIRPMRKRHHLQAGVGHYGVFSGRRWETQIYPLVRNLILAQLIPPRAADRVWPSGRARPRLAPRAHSSSAAGWISPAHRV